MAIHAVLISSYVPEVGQTSLDCAVFSGWEFSEIQAKLVGFESQIGQHYIAVMSQEHEMLTPALKAFSHTEWMFVKGAGVKMVSGNPVPEWAGVFA